ncbi:hypothetical protein BDR06DRAFT_1044714 [Suillus hirtellus]|nr:hypothetical protein BDR06DRAFT_1044714 [Suillus hirtellus]
MSIWRLMTWMMTGSNQLSEAKDGWKETATEILVPTRERNLSRNGQLFTIPGFQYRLLTAVICAAFSEAASKWFHFTPFKRFWTSPVTGQEQCLYDELYTSDAWIGAYNDLQKQKRSDSCPLERVIARLMFWSDSMHLAQFGNASAWPVYLFFGNQSKYMCACPTSSACHPVAFIPTLPESIKGFIAQITLVKRKSYDNILAHCKQELFHAILCILIDNDFVEAYKNGIVIKCYDGVHRRVFPRIFTYSTNYPENMSFKSTAISWRQNHRRPLGFNFFPMLVVDLLHEFELGVFKAVFKHLIRLLHAINLEKITVLNECFHLIPSFGRGTIQRFPSSVSDVRHNAAWHFEDVLQCAIPAFEGLFPAQHDNVICLLLFQLAEWHALAKLRLYTDDSLAQLDQALNNLGKQLRKFQQFTCSAFQTVELPREVAAHQRRYVSKQLAKQERRHTRVCQQRQQQSTALLQDIHTSNLPIEAHHFMSNTSNFLNLSAYLSEHQGNPAIKGFIPKLKDHLLSQLLGLDYDGDERAFTDAERNSVRFINNLNKVSQAKRLQINYTTYDVRHDQDTLKPGYGGAVMTLSREHGNDAHPFWYSMLALTFVIARPNQWSSFPHYRWSMREGHLPKVGFIPDSPSAFGFLDPSVVLRACHLIPSFADGRTDTLLRYGPTVAQPLREVNNWTAFYVNIFADRDMFTHFVGIGVGHVAQYNLSKDMEPEHGPGGCDDEWDIDMSNTSKDDDEDETKTETETKDDDDDDDDDEDDKDTDSNLEEYEDSEDEGLEYKF